MTETVEKAFHWLRDEAWPLWLEHGVDWDKGAFHEHLTHDGLACKADFRRLRVVTRQIFTFSHAAALGVLRAKDAVKLGLAYLDTVAKAPEHDGAYYWRFDLEDAPIDKRFDLYDHAFTLLAFSSAYRLLGDEALAAKAKAVDAFIEAEFGHPGGKGYVESLPPALPRRQNPHMHLLEARLAAAEIFGGGSFFDGAETLIALFADTLFDPEAGALPEFFDDDWVIDRADGRYILEPGHHAEWIWLLDWYARLAARFDRPVHKRTALAKAALAGFMDKGGISATTGALIDEVWSDGTQKALGSRLWPQTERLKAEAMRADTSQAKVENAFDRLAAYFSPTQPGLWAENQSADGTMQLADCPASSLYHLTAGILLSRAHLA